MMHIEETMNKVDSLLQDRGLNGEYEEQAVRQLLYHLYIALDIYRYMTCAEKNKAGYWYRVFRSSFSLRGFLKERKRKRDKEKFPPDPLYKKTETEFKEKAQKMSLCKGRVSGGLEERQKAFWNELLQYEEKYGREMLLKFYAKWAEETVEKIPGARLVVGQFNGLFQQAFAFVDHFGRHGVKVGGIAPVEIGPRIPEVPGLPNFL